VITHRAVRLVRTVSLHEYQRALTAAACDGDPVLVRRTAVLVPTRAAAVQLQRTFEHLRLEARGAAMVLPDLLTRTEWYERLRLAQDPLGEWLSPFDREVLLQAGAHEAITDGTLPPFHLRPALFGEMLEFYDELRRRQRRVDDFERLLTGELEPRASADRGAERMLRQTRFLAAAFRSYERRMNEAGGVDEHAFRAWLIEARVRLRYARVIVAVGDRVAEPGGLWPADFDLLVRAAGIDGIEVVTTEAQLAAGLHARIHDLLPGIEEVRAIPAEAPLDDRVLMVPSEGDALSYTSRDREDEIAAVVRRVKARRRQTPGSVRLDRTAVIFARPLPYVYVARGVFEAAQMPYQCDDALPLAAEPGAAAVDLVLAFVGTRASRSATVALLRSPHLTLDACAPPVPSEAVQALDRALADTGYAGDPARLRSLADEWERGAGARDPRMAVLRQRAAPAARAAARLAEHLAPLFDAAPASVHLETLGRFLLAYGHVPGATDPEHERLLRARTALLTLLDGLASAHRRHGDLRWTADDLAATVRRWIESHTFSPRTGAAGVHLVDATAARFGVFDDVHLVGLVEGEWPPPPRRNAFYSPALLQPLGWPAETARVGAARASFTELLGLARRRTSLSRFQLEDDSLVGPSALLDDVARSGLTPLARPDAATPIFTTEALVARPVAASAVSGDTLAWLRLRLARTGALDPSFHGTALPYLPRTHGVGAVELYAQCPFKYFARHVLRLEEESDDEVGLTPRERGIVLHEVFQAFFERWQAEVGRVVMPADLPRARTLLEDVMAARLASLSPSDAAIERTRLRGSPVAPGLADLVLRMEAERSVPVIGRRLEERFDGVFELLGPEGGRRLPIRGVVDRIDLLGDGALRVIDYKSSVPPAALQLAIYAVTAAQRLEGHLGRRWTVGEASYVVFNGARVRPVGRNPDDRARALADAQLRFVAAADAIHAGAFPPRPAVGHLCTSCAYAGVCRMDHVAEPEDADAAAAV
jgi:inactivated superfamily I helicase